MHDLQATLEAEESTARQLEIGEVVSPGANSDLAFVCQLGATGMTYVAKHFAKSLSDLELKQVLVDKDSGISVWTMKRPDSGFYRVQIIFSPEGIALQGDVRYGDRTGATSDLGYGFNWFQSNLSEDYLCEKFLHREWVAKYAADSLQEEIDDPEEYGLSDEMVAKLKPIIANLKEAAGMMEADLWTEFENIDYECDEMPGYGFHPDKAMALCGVQQRFHQLYQEWKKGQEA